LTFSQFYATIQIIKVYIHIEIIKEQRKGDVMRTKGKRMIFLEYGLLSLVVILFIIFALSFSPILRVFATEKGIFESDKFPEEAFFGDELNPIVTFNLGEVQGWQFFINDQEISSLACCKLEKGEKIIIGVKDLKNNLLFNNWLPNRVDITNVLCPGDIISYEYIAYYSQPDENGNISLIRESVNLYIWHKDYTYEKIPFDTTLNPFTL